ncbi:MAG: hypothetical protein Q9198_003736 [Flavoplaca austrocitrina]
MQSKTTPQIADDYYGNHISDQPSLKKQKVPSDYVDPTSSPLTPKLLAQNPPVSATSFKNWLTQRIAFYMAHSKRTTTVAHFEICGVPTYRSKFISFCRGNLLWSKPASNRVARSSTVSALAFPLQPIESEMSSNFDIQVKGHFGQILASVLTKLFQEILGPGRGSEAAERLHGASDHSNNSLISVSEQ